MTPPTPDHTPKKPGRQKGTQGRSSLERRKTITIPGRRLTPMQNARLIESRQRQMQALELRKAGATYQQIADQLGYKGTSGAERAVKTAMYRLGREQAAEVLSLDMHRLDEIQMRLTAAFRGGDLSQADRILRVMAARWQLVAQYEPRGEGGGGHPSTGGTSSVTNNNVLVIQGSQREYVEGLMRATGADTNTDDARAYLDSLDTKQRALAQGPSGPSPMSDEEANVLEAEIVEQSIDFDEAM